MAAKERNIPIRVGVNSGSLEKELVEKYKGVTAEGLVESALDKVHMIENMGYDNLVISIKSSDVLMCVKAHELIASQTNHPLHVGITEAGTITAGNIKSAIGLGLILSQGIGDTIRVSLTGDPVEEVKSAKLILKTLGLRKDGVEIVSCPTCGRTRIDLIGLANQVENMVQDIKAPIKVAVMGCVVNGPGEAKEADVGIAGGIGEGLIIRKGEVVRKVPEADLLSELRKEIYSVMEEYGYTE
jgi:(E)-4-hydroxy-3-methylbut-2-enyl-diphosphate synthase